MIVSSQNQLGKMFRVTSLFLFLLVFVTGCSDEEKADTSPHSAESMPVNQKTPAGTVPPPGFSGQSWPDILESAKGNTVNWYMWGGSKMINEWVTGYVAHAVKDQYDITLNMVPQKDAAEVVELIRDEKRQGKSTDGSVDLFWVNGENFRALRSEELLYGPWSTSLPNAVLVDWEDPSINNDFAYPVDGYESPYGRAQMVMIYDRSRLPSPPATIEMLLKWIKDNPGKFTYPAPPDFNGSAFIRHICYWAAGGYQRFEEKFDHGLVEEKLAPCFQALNDIAPYLWEKGERYPVSEAQLNTLFRSGEIEFSMNYEVDIASTRIRKGEYPDTVRTFVFQEGTIGNTNYVAIPFNSSNKAGAMVVANFLLSPEVQLDKWTTWGSGLAIDPLLLPSEWRKKVLNIPLGPATLPPSVLDEHRLPEPSAEWVDAIEQGWQDQIFRD